MFHNVKVKERINFVEFCWSYWIMLFRCDITSFSTSGLSYFPRLTLTMRRQDTQAKISLRKKLKQKQRQRQMMMTLAQIAPGLFSQWDGVWFRVGIAGSPLKMWATTWSTPEVMESSAREPLKALWRKEGGVWCLWMGESFYYYFILSLGFSEKVFSWCKVIPDVFL